MIWVVRVLTVTIVSLLLLSFFPYLFGRWPMPNLVLAAVVVFVLDRETSQALLWAAFGGLLLDLSMPGHGFYLVSFVGFTLVTTWLIQRFFARPSLIIGTITSLLAASFLPTIELFVSGGQWTWLWLLAVLSNLLGIIVVFSLRRWLVHRSHHRRLTLGILRDL